MGASDVSGIRHLPCGPHGSPSTIGLTALAFEAEKARLSAALGTPQPPGGSRTGWRWQHGKPGQAHARTHARVSAQVLLRYYWEAGNRDGLRLAAWRHRPSSAMGGIN